MKEELQSKLVEILTSIQTATGKASDFAMQQLPDIAQSYVAYGRVLYTVLPLVLMLVAVAGFVVTAWAAKNPWRGEFGERRGFSNMLVQVVGVAVGGISVINAICLMPSLFLVWFAPKVWLLKELASLVK